MKEPLVGIATCGCIHCKNGQSLHEKKVRNKKRRLHIKNEIIFIVNNNLDDNYTMNTFSQYTD